MYLKLFVESSENAGHVFPEVMTFIVSYRTHNVYSVALACKKLTGNLKL